ncbi:MAG TPA: GNAT family N-acetyltransferase [Pyrinomonadaceae bacterium]|nr:GNAT family N-acetyltransferase [Pyrinomonadaceae bacterium]
MKIIPFQSSDGEQILSIHRKIYQNLHLERFLWQPCQQIESLEKDCFKIVCKDEKIKGYAAVYALDKTHFRLNLLVEPQSARRGIGTKLLRKVESEAKNQGYQSLQARILEGMDAGLAFALANGFTEVHRMRGMSLDAEDFSFEKWMELGKRLAAENFVVTTLEEEIKAGNQRFKKLARLHKEASKDWASPDPTMRQNTDDQHLREIFSNAKKPNRVSIIKHGEKYVGYTSADRENVLGTAVRPDYRGRGVATYLKACNLKMQIDGGTRYIESSSANPAMIRVNQKLGYRLNGLTEIRLVKGV